MSPQEMQELAELLQNVPGIHSIDLKDVRRLAQLLRETPEIGSIEVKGWFGTGVVITRTAAAPVAPTTPVVMPSAMLASPPAGEGESREAGGRAPSAAPHLKEIRSPMVGTFYKAPEPGAEPYIKVGNRVTPWQTVCIIEAMKIMNEIEAEIAGTVREISVDDGQPVEFGQALFRVDPNA
jgi:acetyl-CoA carboxylase biotin carboxyl carrier protein